MDILKKIKTKRDKQLKKELNIFKQPSLKESLNKNGLKIIGEIKKASPSKGYIANENFDLLKQAKYYVDNGISAFSILTEEEVMQKVKEAGFKIEILTQ